MWKDFHINSEIKIATLAEEITNGMYQHDLERLIEIVDDQYPGIDIWFKKKVEIRRKFNKKWEGAYAMLYASKPAQEFFGEARISKVLEDSPEEIWELFNSDLGVDKDRFFQYCHGVETVSALVLSDIEIFRTGILKSPIEFLINEELRPPQSYSGVTGNTNWPTTALLSYLLLA